MDFDCLEPLVIIEDSSSDEGVTEENEDKYDPLLVAMDKKPPNYFSSVSIQKIHLDIPYSPDLENPHAKRKSHPLEQCHICKKFFRRLATHLQKHHNKEDSLKPAVLRCKFCEQEFSSAGRLNTHMRLHSNARNYVCQVCDKSFTQSCNLISHQRIHTGERPFQCPHCDRAFTQSGNLSNHIRLHLDHKPFKCHICHKCFAQSGNLNSHIKNNHRYEKHIKIKTNI